jgi:hypothetical protein
MEAVWEYDFSRDGEGDCALWRKTGTEFERLDQEELT